MKDLFVKWTEKVAEDCENNTCDINQERIQDSLNTLVDLNYVKEK